MALADMLQKKQEELAKPDLKTVVPPGGTPRNMAAATGPAGTPGNPTPQQMLTTGQKAVFGTPRTAAEINGAQIGTVGNSTMGMPGQKINPTQLVGAPGPLGTPDGGDPNALSTLPGGKPNAWATTFAGQAKPPATSAVPPMTTDPNAATAGPPVSSDLNKTTAPAAVTRGFDAIVRGSLDPAAAKMLRDKVDWSAGSANALNAAAEAKYNMEVADAAKRTDKIGADRTEAQILKDMQYNNTTALMPQAQQVALSKRQFAAQEEKNAKALGAETTKYGDDSKLKGTQISSDASLKAADINAKSVLGGHKMTADAQKYAADKTAEAANTRTQAILEQGKTTTDQPDYKLIADGVSKDLDRLAAKLNPTPEDLKEIARLTDYQNVIRKNAKKSSTRYGRTTDDTES